MEINHTDYQEDKGWPRSQESSGGFIMGRKTTPYKEKLAQGTRDKGLFWHHPISRTHPMDKHFHRGDSLKKGWAPHCLQNSWSKEQTSENGALRNPCSSDQLPNSWLRLKIPWTCLVLLLQAKVSYTGNICRDFFLISCHPLWLVSETSMSYGLKAMGSNLFTEI